MKRVRFTALLDVAVFACASGAISLIACSRNRGLACGFSNTHDHGWVGGKIKDPLQESHNHSAQLRLTKTPNGRGGTGNGTALSFANPANPASRFSANSR